MALRLPDRWIWDFWLAQDGDSYHLFFVQAPRSRGVVGHATSDDLVTGSMPR